MIPESDIRCVAAVYRSSALPRRRLPIRTRWWKLASVVVVSAVVAAACGENATTTISSGAAASSAPTRTTASTSTTTIVAEKPCSAKASPVALARIAEPLRNSPMDAIIDAPVAGADRLPDSSTVDLGTVVGARAVVSAPFNIIPLDNGGSTNEFAGNAAFWSGVAMDVRVGSTRLVVNVPLIAGGADVLAAMASLVPEIDGPSLAGACAAVIVHAGDPSGGDAQLLAIATDPAAPPLPVSARYAAALESVKTISNLTN